MSRCAALHPAAPQIIPASYGQVPIERVFGADAQGLVARLNTEGQHRGAVAAAKSVEAEEKAAAEAEKVGREIDICGM